MANSKISPKSKQKTKTIEVTSDAITNTIEQKAEKNFFSKRNNTIISFMTILSIVLVALTMVYILRIDFINLFKQISSGFTLALGPMWFSILLFSVIIIFYSNVGTLLVRTKKIGIKIPTSQVILFTICLSFIRTVTPANLVSDPYMVFWLKTNKISTSRAASLMLSNAWIWELVQILVTLPSFIIICMQYDAIVKDNVLGMTAFWCAVVGIIIDVIGLAVMSVLGFSKNIHFWLSSIFNWIKKKLHMKYHTVEESKEKYQNRATIKKDFIDYIYDWKSTLYCSLIIAGSEVLLYCHVYFSIAFIAKPEYALDFCGIFNAINVAVTANKFNLIPGGSIGIELMSLILVDATGGLKNIPPTEKLDFLSNAILIWRCFTAYIPALIGLFGFGGLTYIQIRLFRQKKEKIIDSSYE